MNCIVLAEDEAMAKDIQYTLEDMGETWRCIPLTKMDQSLSLLQENVEVLLLLPCPESERILHMLQIHPPLAAPFIFGIGMEGPDGTLSDAKLLPEKLQIYQKEGYLPVLASRYLPMTIEIAAALMHTMEVPQRLRAWAFLPEMMAMTVVHPPLLQDLRHGLYPLIASRHGMTPSAVERSLRLCVESTWSHGSFDALERFFGSSVDPERGKPTNREFLCRVQERLTLTMRRMVLVLGLQ